MSSREEESTTLSLVPTQDRRESSSCLAIRWITDKGHDCSMLSGSPLTLGRGADAGLRVDSAGVSRHHAEIIRQGPVFSIRDLGSRNGTFVNGRAVKHAALSEGDVLRLGDAVGVVARVDPARSNEPPLELAGALFGPDVAELFAQLRLVAPSDLPVVVVGETGVGKESVARALHLLSGREGPFHAVNCAALPAALAEAELFGHRKGAFSGAETAGVGHLRAAQGGTLLLDELADLPLSVQAKLLRVLQEKQVTPLGETRALPLDVRIVGACQQPLGALVASKRLRQDLAARLAGAILELPALRERRSDTGYFFGYFLRKFSGGRPPRVDAKLLERLLLYRWPNNVRELALLTQRLLVVHGQEPVLKQSLLPEAFGRSEAEAPSSPASSVPVAAPTEDRNQHDLRLLRAALEACDGNISRAAAKAGISRQRAYRLMGGQSPSQAEGFEEADDGAHGTRT
ncbi:MAG TPA: sigma 54-interacting transcriptional regulator [Polyangiaceae bacterium]|nr:sigma 54-interacting transcriptional regulator [Polyangiaceae bacterium]